MKTTSVRKTYPIKRGEGWGKGSNKINHKVKSPVDETGIGLPIDRETRGI